MLKQLALPIVLIALTGCSLFPGAKAPASLAQTASITSTQDACSTGEQLMVSCTHSSEIAPAKIDAVIEYDFIAALLMEEMAAEEVEVTDQFTELAVSHF